MVGWRVLLSLSIAACCCSAYVPVAPRRACVHRPVQPGKLAPLRTPLIHASEKGDSTVAAAPPSDGQLVAPLPDFSWRKVAFFCLNPAALAPLPLVALLFGRFGWRLNILGPAFVASAASARLGTIMPYRFFCSLSCHSSASSLSRRSRRLRRPPSAFASTPWGRR